jgi:hypothetical protein
MIAAVPKASVVITNPTHYAVALKYERGIEAPICVAKGVEALALKIREVAGEHSIPIVENPAARPCAACHRRGRPADPGRALQGGGRSDRLHDAAAPGGSSVAVFIQRTGLPRAGSCADRPA